MCFRPDLIFWGKLFENCRELAGPDGFIIIGNVCYGCLDDRWEISVPEGVQAVSSGAFREMEMCRKIILPDSVRAVGYGAFRDCSHLEEIRLPAAVRDLGKDPFEGCSALLTVVAPGIEPEKFPEPMAALSGFCAHADKYADTLPAYEEWVKRENVKKKLLEICVDRSLLSQADYFYKRGLVPQPLFSELLERAQRKGKTEMVAAILEYRKHFLPGKSRFGHYQI